MSPRRKPHHNKSKRRNVRNADIEIIIQEVPREKPKYRSLARALIEQARVMQRERNNQTLQDSQDVQDALNDQPPSPPTDQPPRQAA